MEKRAKFHGSMPALVTPFKDGKFDEPAFRALVDWQISAGLARARAGGHHRREPDAEPRGAPPRRRRLHRRGARPRAGHRGRGLQQYARGDRTRAPRREGRRRRGAGRHALLQQADPGRALSHFKAINDAIGIPILIYNIPPRSVIDMSVETMKRLYELKNIVGVKDATGDVGRVSLQRHAMGPDFIQLSGEDMTALAHMAAGGHGCISVTANVAPALCAELMEAVLKGDYAACAASAGPPDAAACRDLRRARRLRASNMR
jgi:4-hydroxy-tetrahydrodipicolinate synthase